MDLIYRYHTRASAQSRSPTQPASSLSMQDNEILYMFLTLSEPLCRRLVDPGQIGRPGHRNTLAVFSGQFLKMIFATLWVLSFSLCALGAGTPWTATPFNPASVPLAVRSPYLSAWLPQGPGTALNTAWPGFWNGQILGWAGFINVDGKSYSWMGAPAVPGATFTPAAQKSLEFTSTQSVFVMSAGPVDLQVTFLSPIEPTDLVKQSIPFSYISLAASSTDGDTHQVSVYSDISGEWVAGDLTSLISWNTTVGSVVTHSVQLQTQGQYTETSDRINQGAAYYSTPSSSSVSYQTGADAIVRAQFIKNGVLTNGEDVNFRAVKDTFPVFALSHNLGAVGASQTTPVVVSVGHVRNPAVQYILANNQLQNRSLYFWSAFTTIDDVISSFLSDYAAATQRANALDKLVQADAQAVSSDYAGVVALSLRQALAALEITVSLGTDNKFNTSDTLVFMKEISSDGNANTVDVIFPAWPALLYINPLLGKHLLQGLFEYQATGQYPNKYSVHDLGANYPKAIGHNDGKDEAMPVEESGNMLIMTLSYTQATNDTSLITNYYSLLDQWTQFLISDSLVPANQISTDDFAGPLANQTNLAIKGIIGIRAMSEIATLVGDNLRISNYSSIAASYVTQFEAFATSADRSHLTLSYGNDSSWGLAYNLYGDKLLKLNLFPESVYQMQTAWYTSGVAHPFGVQLDTRHTYTKTDWQLWTASFMGNTAARDLFISAVKNSVSNGLNNAPFSDFYDTITGVDAGFRARPVVGGHLAIMTLSGTPTIGGRLKVDNSTATAPTNSKKNTAPQLNIRTWAVVCSLAPTILALL